MMSKSHLTNKLSGIVYAIAPDNRKEITGAIKKIKMPGLFKNLHKFVETKYCCHSNEEEN